MSATRNSLGNEYYYIQQSRPVNLWRILLDLVLVVLTIGMAAGLIMAYLSTGISPVDNWIFAFFGLGAPFLFLGNLVMLLLWAIRWRRWVFIPLVTLLLGIGHLGALIQFDLKKDYLGLEASPQSPDEISIMTYNVHGFLLGQTQHSGYLKTLDSIAAYTTRVNPDIICLQEYETMTHADTRLVDTLFQAWPYRSYNFIYGGADDIGYGTAIFSKLPIIGARRMIFEESSNSLLRTDILLPGRDTIRIFNNHLQSTQVDEMSQQRVEQLKVSGDSGTEQFVRSLGSRLRDNYRRRAVQVDTVSRLIAQSPYPVIIVGDFNDTPVSYTYKKMRGDLEDTFINAGAGFAYTFNRLFSMLRIDYIFHTSDFTTVSYRSDNLPWSDHNPVIVRLKRNPIAVK